ncbi:MAG: hypothetical protein P1U64_07275 [Alcanivoracaceae bacterium]|nr:hypothetical protein [Alcanivoracaceae bacterium]
MVTIGARIFAVLFLLGGLAGCASLSGTGPYQQDADLIRLEHLAYWSGLVEEYQAETGRYPLQDRLTPENEVILVKIATRQQMKYLSQGMSQFTSVPVASFVSELEAGLEREIAEKYDIQKVPTTSPVGYYYFATEDGYLLWVTCRTCGVTEISTLLMDGVTPTVNIVSPGMKGQVVKALTREEMLSHPVYQGWRSRPFNKEAYVRGLVEENARDSK